MPYCGPIGNEKILTEPSEPHSASRHPRSSEPSRWWNAGLSAFQSLSGQVQKMVRPFSWAMIVVRQLLRFYCS